MGSFVRICSASLTFCYPSQKLELANQIPAPPMTVKFCQIAPIRVKAPAPPSPPSTLYFLLLHFLARQSRRGFPNLPAQRFHPNRQSAGSLAGSVHRLQQLLHPPHTPGRQIQRILRPIRGFPLRNNPSDF